MYTHSQEEQVLKRRQAGVHKIKPERMVPSKYQKLPYARC